MQHICVPLTESLLWRTESQRQHAVAGTGIVGLLNTMPFVQHHQVVAIDIIPKHIALLNIQHVQWHSAELVSGKHGVKCRFFTKPVSSWLTS